MGIKRIRRRAAWSNLALGAASFLLCGGLSAMAWRHDVGAKNIGVASITVAEKDCYLAYNNQEFDTAVLYYGLDAASVKNLKKADVLFLGQSHVLFACREEILQPFFRQHGLSYFVLAFANRESGILPLEIMRRFDLHPKLLIINTDFFFNTAMSNWAKKIVNAGAWSGFKLVLEGASQFWAQHYIHAVIPKWSGWDDAKYQKPGIIAFRSSQHGEWFVHRFGMQQDKPLTVTPSNDPMPPGWIEAASEYKREIDKRDVQVVFQSVPYDHPEPDGAEIARTILNAPLVAPSPAQYSTVDGSHLNEESASRYMRGFLKELEKTQQFKGVLRRTSAVPR